MVKKAGRKWGMNYKQCLRICIARLILLSLCANNGAEIQLWDFIKKGFAIICPPLFSYASLTVFKSRYKH